MNKVELIGRLTRKPEIRTTGNGDKVANFTLAVDRRRRTEGQQEADFIRCVCFKPQAEFAEKYFQQGTRIALVGHIQTGSYEKDGKKVYTTDVVAEELEFAGSKKDNTDSAADGTQASAPLPADGFINVPDGIDDELPFI